MQLEKIKSKNGSLTWPYMALTKKKKGFKSNWSLIFERPNRRERGRRGKERRREEEEEEEKRKKEEPSQGMETNLDYGFYEIWYGSLVLYDYYLAQT